MSRNDLTESALSGNFDLRPVNLAAPIELRRSKRAQRSIAQQSF